MKALELTEEHKSKLLEMIEKLFPDIKWQCYDLANGKYSNSDKHYEELWVVQNNTEFMPVYIHWFEFCHCHLLPKLIEDRNLRLQFYMDTFTGNPIGYLYEEFLKLKQ